MKLQGPLSIWTTDSAGIIPTSGSTGSNSISSGSLREFVFGIHTSSWGEAREG